MVCCGQLRSPVENGIQSLEMHRQPTPCAEPLRKGYFLKHCDALKELGANLKLHNDFYGMPSYCSLHHFKQKYEQETRHRRWKSSQGLGCKEGQNNYTVFSLQKSTLYLHRHRWCLLYRHGGLATKDRVCVLHIACHADLLFDNSHHLCEQETRHRRWKSSQRLICKEGQGNNTVFSFQRTRCIYTVTDGVCSIAMAALQ